MSKLALKLTALTVLFVLPIAAPAALADILVSNLSEPLNPNGPTVIGNTPFGPDNQAWAAQSFITDNQQWTVLSIEGIMGNATVDLPPMVVELRRDTGFNEIDLTPGGLIDTLGFPTMDGPNSVRSFSFLQAPVLAPNARYWFVVGMDPNNTDDTVEWEYSDTGFFSGTGSLSTFAFSEDSGTTWSYVADPAPLLPWTLQVSGTASAIPEPGSAGIGLVGLLALAICRGRRRRR